MAKDTSRKRRPRGRHSKPLGKRLLLGLKAGLLQAGLMLGAIFIFVIGYALIFPDSPLPNFQFRGRPHFERPLPSAVERVTAEESGFHLQTDTGQPQLAAGATVKNTGREKNTGPIYVRFIFLDDADEEVVSTRVALMGIEPGKNLHLSSTLPWHEDLPASLNIEVQGASFSHAAVTSEDLPTTSVELQTTNSSSEAVGSVTNSSDQTAEFLRVHCIYFANDKILGGARTDLDALTPNQAADWALPIGADADSAACSVIDRPDGPES